MSVSTLPNGTIAVTLWQHGCSADGGLALVRVENNALENEEGRLVQSARCLLCNRYVEYADAELFPRAATRQEREDAADLLRFEHRSLRKRLKMLKERR